MNHQPVQARLITSKGALLVLLMAVGAYAAFIRYSQGLGASTNLSDQYPWGLWIGVDVMSGVALAAGGFIAAALVYLFGGDKYYPLVRPAVLTGLLGYAFVGIGLLVDLALPWHIWHAVIYWPEHSVMFEVAWCVMLYLTVLGLEFAQPVLERFGLTGKTMTAWRLCSNGFAVVALSFFVGAMSLSWQWAAVTLVFTSVLATVLWRIGPRRPGVPIMLIVAGVILSTMHQSSLGSLFLLMKGKLHALWWSPALPINFFLSAVAVGFAIVIFEATLSAKAFGRPIEKDVLSGMGRFLGYALWIYMGFRAFDLAAQGASAQVVAGPKSNLFLLEMAAGFLLPAVMLSSPKLREHTGARFLAATLVVLGTVFNRCNVAWLAMDMPGEGTYVPSLYEILITVSIAAALMLFFALGVKVFPVFATEEERTSMPSPGGASA